MEPRGSRPRIPPEYGRPGADAPLLPWSFVDERMAAALRYWLASVAPGGEPHPRPVDGIWLDGRLYFGGAPATRWRRNLQADPRAAIHLEDAEQAVILHGHVRFAFPERALAERLAAASQAKYGYAPSAETYEARELLVFEPRTVYAWQALDQDATRWEL